MCGPEEPEGTVAPASADSVGIQLSIEWAGATASTIDTVCNNWEPVFSDGDEEE